MASSQGNATVTPAARRKVRLERRFCMTIMKSPSVHLKKFAADDSQDQAGELVIVRGHTGGNASPFGPVLALDAPPERVDEHFLGETFRKGLLLLFQDCFQLRRALEGSIGRPAAPLPRLVFPYRRGTGNWARRASKRWPVRVLPRRNRPASVRRPRSSTALRFPGKSPGAGKRGSPDSRGSVVRMQPCNGH